MTDKAERFWDGRAAAYDDADDSGQADETLLGDIRQHLRPEDGVLDVGCATGTYTLAIAGDVAQVTGIDISSQMIDLARQKAAAQGASNVTFRQATLADDAYDEATFDVVLALNVLHLVPSAAEAVARAGALLKPGGRLITETPCLGQKRSLLGLFLRGLSRIGLVPHLSAMSSHDLDALVAGAGLQRTAAELRPGTVNSYFLVATKA